MSISKSECRKFSPNIFNKSKCQHCFGSKDSHSAEALESNRASRRVSKCGYLFVAPDWDFSNPINRTKRWQRRWFVLYDDGELTYSVDEHPETVPQAIIDMTKVLEVTDAEEVTGNQFSIAITAPEKAHFIKGTSKEESRWWYDVLVMFPRSLKGTRHKRNATFPGGKATTTISSPLTSLQHQIEESSQTVSISNRPRFLSCQTDQIPKTKPVPVLWSANKDVHLDEDVFGREPIILTPTVVNVEAKKNEVTDNYNNKNTSENRKQRQESTAMTRTTNARDQQSGVDRARARRLSKRGSQSHRSRSDVVNLMIPKNSNAAEARESPAGTVGNAEEFESSDVHRQSRTVQSGNAVNRAEEKLDRDEINSLSPQQRYHNDKNLELTRRHAEGAPDSAERNESRRKIESSTVITTGLDNNKNYFIPAYIDMSEKENLGQIVSSRRNCRIRSISVSEPYSDIANTQSTNITTKVEHGDHHSKDRKEEKSSEPTVRGDPDGCGLDGNIGCPSSIPDIHVEVHPEELVYKKKGWLMKQTEIMEWSKFWFVLHGTSLLYYQDPTAEENGSHIGILDLSQVRLIQEVQEARNYGFQLKCYGDIRWLLSAVTAGIRGSWIQVLRTSGNIKDAVKEDIIDKTTKNDQMRLTLGERIEKEMSMMKKLNNSLTSSINKDIPPETKEENHFRGSLEQLDAISSGGSVPSVLSSDDEFKTASEASGRMEDHCEWGDEEPDHTASSSSRALPPSPPLNRTPLSRVKERARSRSNSRAGISQEWALDSEVKTQKRSGSAVRAPRRPSKDELLGKEDLSGSDRECSNAHLHPLNLPHLKVTGQNVKKESQPLLASVETNSRTLLEKLETDIESLKMQLQQAEARLLISRNCNDSNMTPEQDATPTASPCPTDLALQVAELMDRLARASRESAEKSEKVQELEGWQQRHHDLLHRYHSLRNRLELLEMVASPSEREQALCSNYDRLEERYLSEKAEWEQKVRLGEEKLKDSLTGKSRAVKSLEDRLQQSENTIVALTNEIDRMSQASGKYTVPANLKKDSLTESGITSNLEALLQEKEAEIKRYKQEVISLKVATDRTSRDSALINATKKENGPNNSSQWDSMPLTRMDSLSDLTNISFNEDTESMGSEALVEECKDLRKRFEKAVNEIRALRRELREAHRSSDDLELQCIKLKQDLKSAVDDYESELKLMSVRIEDLTAKLSNTEKQSRQLKQKALRQENKEQRRTRSLKGKEAFTISKDLELKLEELEKKFYLLENAGQLNFDYAPSLEPTVSKRSEQKITEPCIEGRTDTIKISVEGSSSDMTQTPLPSSPSQSNTLADSIQLLVRINSLDSKIATLAKQNTDGNMNASISSQTNNSVLGSSIGDCSIVEESDAELKDVNSEGDCVPNFTVSLEGHGVSGKSVMDTCLEMVAAQSVKCTCMNKHGWVVLSERLKEMRITNSTGSSKLCTEKLHEVKKLYDLLQRKLAFIETKRMELGRLGLLSTDIKLSLGVESAISEALLIQVMSSTLNIHYSKFVDAKITSQILAFFIQKISNLAHNYEGNISSIDSKGTRNSVINFPEVFSSNCSWADSKLSTAPKTLSDLNNGEEKLKELMAIYQNKQLPLLASALAHETYSRTGKERGTTDSVESSSSFASNNEDGSHPSRKQIELEINQVFARLSLLYEQELILQFHTGSLLFGTHQLHEPNIYSLNVQSLISSLNRDMDAALEDLRGHYHKAMTKRFRPLVSGEPKDCSVVTLVGEYAAMMAQHSIILNRIIQSKKNLHAMHGSPHSNESNITAEDKDLIDKILYKKLWMWQVNADSLASNILRSECDGRFQIPMNQARISVVLPNAAKNSKAVLPDTARSFDDSLASRKLNKDPNSSFPKTVMNPQSGSTYHSVQDILQGTADGKPSLFMRSYEARNQRSFRMLRSQRCVTLPMCTADTISPGSAVISSSELSSSTAEGQDFQTQLQALKDKHGHECRRLSGQHSVDLEAVQQRLESRLAVQEERHAEEVSKLMIAMGNLDEQFKATVEEYEQQITALKDTYEQEMTVRNNPKINEESIRQRYQAEIEQLRGLCEKGLVAMENSHKRIIVELEEKHRQDLEQLHVEKEQALAEETQATLAALDAMRKAHEVELHREITKFKREFLQKMQSTHDFDSIHKEHEEEMDNIKQEILSLSDKYSIKCLENASLEEQIGPLTRQLSEANNLVFELTARNKQLRTMLNSNMAELKVASGTQEINSGSLTQDDHKMLKLTLQLKENELLGKVEEISELQHKLQLARNHERDLESQWRLLDQSLKAERRLREDEVTSLRTRLEHIILTSNASLEASKATSSGAQEERASASMNRMAEPKAKRLSAILAPRGRELMRSPSCPGLSDATPSILLRRMSVSAATLAASPGVVASRKKIFEQTASED